jgi:hypothetical protein
MPSDNRPTANNVQTIATAAPMNRGTPGRQAS